MRAAVRRTGNPTDTCGLVVRCFAPGTHIPRPIGNPAASGMPARYVRITVPAWACASAGTYLRADEFEASRSLPNLNAARGDDVRRFDHRGLGQGRMRSGNRQLRQPARHAGLVDLAHEEMPRIGEGIGAFPQQWALRVAHPPEVGPSAGGSAAQGPRAQPVHGGGPRCVLPVSSSDTRHYGLPKNGNSRRISSAVGRRPYSEISNASAYCTASPRCAP